MQARAADVDLLDQLVERRLGVAPRPCKRIQIHDDEVDRLDALSGQRREVVGPMAAGQDAAVDRRMEGLDAAVHHLGEAGDVGHVRDRQARSCKSFRGSAGGDDVDVTIGEGTGQRDDSRSCPKRSGSLAYY